MRKGDIMIGVAICFISLLCFFIVRAPKGEVKEIVISVDGEVYDVILYGEEKTFEIETEFGYNEVVATASGVYVKHADCDDLNCVHMGIISQVGRTIICAPHRLVIKLVGDHEEVDTLTS